MEHDYIPALDASLERVQAAHRAGYAAYDQGYSTRACPFDDLPRTKAERTAWLKGWAQSQRDGEPATS